MIFDKEQIQKYFERIDFNEQLSFSGDYLSKLISKHFQKIPYENLDILNQVELQYNPDDLYNKIITNGRGGYCFELNGILGHLIRSLGFEVIDCMARFLYNEQTIPMRRHRILVVKTDDGDYMCDVGVGMECSRIALKMVEDFVQEDGFCSYRFKKEKFFGWVLYQKKPSEDWEKFFSFTLEEQLDIDFIMPSFYCEKHKDSIFNKTPILSIRTPDGRITCNDHTFKIFKGLEVVDSFDIVDENQFNEYIERVYNIKF